MRLEFGLQTRIIILVVFGLAIIFGVFTYLALHTLNESTQRSLAERLAVASLIAAHSDEHLREAFDMIDDFARPELLDTDGEALAIERAQLAAEYQRSALLDYAVFLADARGDVLWSAPSGTFPVGMRLPAFDTLEQGLRSGQSQVSDLVYDPHSGKPLVLVAEPIAGRDNQFLGLVGGAGDLSSGRLSMLVGPVSMGDSGYAEIVDRNGRVLASTLQERLFEKDDHANRFFTLLLNKQPVVGLCHRCHEPETTSRRQNDVLAFSPLRNAPWGVALRQLEAEVLAPTREMSQRIVLVGLPLFAFALAVAWLTARHIVRPIRSLTAASERIAKGDLDFAVRLSGRDELGALATAFEIMRVKLRASYQEIEAWNRDLEHRVEQRTRDLATIFHASQVLSSTLELGTLLHELVPRLVDVIRQAGAGALYLNSEDEETLVVRSSHGYEPGALSRLRLVPGEGIAGKVFRSTHPFLWPSSGAIVAAMSDLSPANSEVWKQAQHTFPAAVATIGAPLIAQGRAIGCLILDSTEQRQAFAAADLSLVQTIADRIAVAIENARLYDELQRKEQLRGQLLEKVIVAQEDERKRIARELHDETGQSLTALALSLASAQEATPPGAVAVNHALAQAKSLADKLLSEIRRLISDLRPTVLDDLGLVPALRRYATTHAEMLRLEVQLRVEGRRRRLSPQAETTLFRVVQEALTNVAKHAQAKSVDVRLMFEDQRVVVEVRDDGLGFEVSQVLGAASTERGVGLLGMRERASLLGGTLEIVSAPGEGTRLIVALPLVGEGVYSNEFADKGLVG